MFIIAADLGWSDTALYGTRSFYETPNIERLARRGLVFTNACTAHPLGSPTRASIMTGQAPGRVGCTSGLPSSSAAIWSRFYDHHLNGKPEARPGSTRAVPERTTPRRRGAGR